MNILEVRKLLTEALEQSGQFDKIQPLGHCVYVHVDKQEYEVVLRTVRANMTKPITEPDHDGPLAQ
jgi:hypothetical protein